MSLIQFAEQRFKDLQRHSGVTEKSFRARAWEEFSRLGLPDRKTESWRYSPLTGLSQKEWKPADADLDIWARALLLRDQWKNEFDVLVIQNGRWRKDQSVISESSSLSNYDFEREVSIEDGFSGLSVAIGQPGFQLRVENGVKRKPVLVLHVVVGEDVWSTGLHQIIVESEAQLDVAEVFLGQGRYLRSDQMTLEVGERAHVNWLRVQDDSTLAQHYSVGRAKLSQGGVLNLAQIHSGSVWTRCQLSADIHAVAAEAHLFGLTFARQQQHIDQRVVANHWVGQSFSSQLFKGVLKDRCRAVVNGRIFIAKEAQKVSSSQLNHNLILTPGAEADTKPELEIYADDVKANHGASVGRMDEDKLFYLESRGIRRSEAMQMLAKAFAADVLMKIPSVSLRRLAERTVNDILPEFAEQMEHG